MLESASTEHLSPFLLRYHVTNDRGTVHWDMSTCKNSWKEQANWNWLYCLGPVLLNVYFSTNLNPQLVLISISWQETLGWGLAKHRADQSLATRRQVQRPLSTGSVKMEYSHILFENSSLSPAFTFNDQAYLLESREWCPLLKHIRWTGALQKAPTTQSLQKGSEI